MDVIHIQYHTTPIGEFILGSFQNKLCILDFRYRKLRTTIDKRIMTALNTSMIEANNAILEKAKQQIDQYLQGNLKHFDIEFMLVGTSFQKQVWKALMDIPYGDTVSYLELAQKLQHEKAVRAVASANGANALSLVIPCHRVIQTNGDLGGYGGGITAKRKLLSLENKNSTHHSLVQ